MRFAAASDRAPGASAIQQGGDSYLFPKPLPEFAVRKAQDLQQGYENGAVAIFLLRVT
jgi:hypothetical protein